MKIPKGLKAQEPGTHPGSKKGVFHVQRREHYPPHHTTLSQHDRVVFLRARKQGISVDEYKRRWGWK